MNTQNVSITCQIARDMVSIASRITQYFTQVGFTTINKFGSPVTVADFACQIYLNAQFRTHFPTDAVICEEDSRLLTDAIQELIADCFRTLQVPEEIAPAEFKTLLNYRGNAKSARVWCVDPIDGTRGYVKNLSYAIGIGLLENNTPTLAAIAVPAYDTRGTAIFYAEAGKGAFTSYGGSDFESIHVSETHNLNEATLLRSLHEDAPIITKVIESAKIPKATSMDSFAKFCHVADGTADIVMRPIAFYGNIWDFAPGILLVQEAGGMVSDFAGNSILFHKDTCQTKKGGILATNKALHPQLMQVLQKL